MIIVAREGRMFVWALSVCASIFGRPLDGNGGCVWEGSSSYGCLSGSGAHMIKEGLPCGRKDHSQS